MRRSAEGNKVRWHSRLISRYTLITYVGKNYVRKVFNSDTKIMSSFVPVLGTEVVIEI